MHISKYDKNVTIYAQKKCIRILFGDNKAYRDRFCTCARAREFGKHILGSQHYKLEGTKPLFNNNIFLTVHNLLRYHSAIITYKVIRSRTPYSLFALFKFSDHIETRLKSQGFAGSYVDSSTTIWNNIREKLHINDFDMTIAQTKNSIKRYLLSLQKAHDEHELCILNYKVV